VRVISEKGSREGKGKKIGLASRSSTACYVSVSVAGGLAAGVQTEREREEGGEGGSGLDKNRTSILVPYHSCTLSQTHKPHTPPPTPTLSHSTVVSVNRNQHDPPSLYLYWDSLTVPMIPPGQRTPLEQNPFDRLSRPRCRPHFSRCRSTKVTLRAAVVGICKTTLCSDQLSLQLRQALGTGFE
jgi:hypothetical protein